MLQSVYMIPQKISNQPKSGTFVKAFFEILIMFLVMIKKRQYQNFRKYFK